MKVRFLVLVCVMLLLSSCVKPVNAPSSWVPQHNYEGAMSDTGFYYLRDSFLHYADFSTGINVCLCSRAGCSHDSDTDCEAAIHAAGTHGSMFVWNEMLYYIGIDGYGIHIFCRNADGTGSRKLTSLCTAYTEQKKVVDVANYALADGFLYYCAAIQDLVERSDGGFEVQTELYAVCKVNLSTGKDEVLFTESEYTLTLWAARAGEVLCFASTAPENADAEDYLEQLEKSPCQLFTWSEKTQQRTVLFDKVHRDCSSVYGFVDGKFYYSYITDENFINVTEFDISTKAETLVGHEYPRIINSRYSLYMVDDSHHYILLDQQAGKKLPVDFEGQFLRIINVSDKSLILCRGQFSSETSTTITAKIYCYVPLAALADGLQEADVIDFFIR